jgi:hypothetical protein
MRDFSSGVRYRWCGSLPVGILWVSFQVEGSITLTVASSELRTNIGGGLSLAIANEAQKNHANGKKWVQRFDDFTKALFINSRRV